MSIDVLFEPTNIGNVELKNRIAMAPMNMGWSGPWGFPSPQTYAWYATRAKGGFGLLITEAIVANPFKWRGSDLLNPLLMHNERHHRFLSRLVNIVHSYDKVKICAQISAGWGRQGVHWPEDPSIPAAGPSSVPLHLDFRLLNKGWMKGMKPLAPALIEGIGDYDKFQQMSDEEYEKVHKMILQGVAATMPELYHVFEGPSPRELTIPEIEDLVDVMVEQICRAYDIGFDAVEIHTPHGYLLHSFLSPRCNKRVDKYGGSLENRGRIVTDIITRVREKIGPDKPLGARLSGDELTPGGMTHEEACKFITLFKDAGCNFFNISQGSYENPGAFGPDKEDAFSRWAPGFKKASGGLPIVCPGWTVPETAAEAVRTGAIDIISLGRPAIADAYWPAKAKAGRTKDIVKCARCQNCYLMLNTARWCYCSVNPSAGLEEYYPELWKNSGFDSKVKRYLQKFEGLL